MKKLRLIIIIFLAALFQFQEAKSMQSVSYKIEEDAVSFGGTDEGRSASYNLKDTMGEIGTGLSDGASYDIKAGYRQMADDGEPSLSFAISDVAIGFGTLSASSIHYATADDTTATTEPGNTLPVQLTLSTNADNGAEITIRSSNAGLKRTLPSVNTIAATGPSSVALGNPSYAAYGKNASSLTIVAGFATGGTTALTTADQSFVTVATPVAGGTADLSLKAGIAAITKPGYYSDTLTLVATGKF